MLTARIYALEHPVVTPFETAEWSVPTNQIDVHILAVLHAHTLEPAHSCSDAVFVRRVYLDLIGTLPPPEAVRSFLRDTRPAKRAILIDELLERQEFAEYWSLKWCDLLRVKAEFPINLWPNAVQAYHRWIYDAIRLNMPYDQFARELLTSSGSNFRDPPVNFYRAIQERTPVALAGAAALTFMGTRIDSWPEERRNGLAAFFSRVAYKSTAEWKEEIVCFDPAPTNRFTALFPDGKTVIISSRQDPLRAFADWLIADDNPWFARVMVNRIWFWLMGRGIIHEPDDLRPDNPPSHPELLAYLEKKFIEARYDMRTVFRLILNSHTYQQSSIPSGAHSNTNTFFANYPVRRLDAEVLIDALDWIGNTGERYTSAIPEPFTFIPEEHRTIALADGSISSPFLELFGRPARDTGLVSERNNQPSAEQRLYLINSSDIQNKISKSKRWQRLFKSGNKKPRAIIDEIYLTIVSRLPTPAEIAAIQQYFASGDRTRKQSAEDLIWSLVNSKEFLYKH